MTGLRRLAILLAFCGTTLAGAAVSSPVAAQTGSLPVIAGAADLQYALAEIAQQFTKDTGRQVRLTFGSSGNFATQILQGAPFDLFFSADEEYVQKVVKAGLAIDDGALYAIGRVGIFVPHGSVLKADSEMADLKAALADGRIKKFSIANPDHAPYGVAARSTLKHQGLWERIEPLLVLGENASQATQFATVGGAQGGIIPYSLALAPAVAKAGTFALLPEAWHAPLRQRMVLLKRADDTARAFYEYVQQPAARAIFKRYGFVLPGESS
jgi:molybdate transport system substrate-binding protein